MMRVSDLGSEKMARLLARFGLHLDLVPPGAPIPGSYWGEPEAGLSRDRLYARADTPIHSLLHEASHFVCMTPDRRARLERDAGGDDLEESGVCYLQVLLAAELPDVGRDRMFEDMDAWGYSFRLGSTRRWFEEDADDARTWLVEQGLVDEAGRVLWRLRG
jgi:hypothetical protein